MFRVRKVWKNFKGISLDSCVNLILWTVVSFVVLCFITFWFISSDLSEPRFGMYRGVYPLQDFPVERGEDAVYDIIMDEKE